MLIADVKCTSIPTGMDASLRRLMQRLRDISIKAGLQILETSPVRCIKDVSLETYLRCLRSSQKRF